MGRSIFPRGEVIVDTLAIGSEQEKTYSQSMISYSVGDLSTCRKVKLFLN